MVLLPDWLAELGVREEKARAAAGLTPKADGWYKSIGGRTRYVCKPMPVEEAVEELDRRFPGARKGEAAGQVVRLVDLTLERLVEKFLARELERVRTGSPTKLARRTYDDKVDVLARFAAVVGPARNAAALGPPDFTAYRRTLAGRAPSTVRREMIYIDSMLNWAGPGRFSANILPTLDVGPDWIRPTDDELHTAGADADKAYTADQLRAAFAAVRDKPLLNAAAHLGLNAGFIPKDIATLPERYVDLDGGFILFPRGKTGIRRLCWLVPQTAQALRDYLAVRPQRKPEAAALFFVNALGGPLGKHHGPADAESEWGRESNGIVREWDRAMGRRKDNPDKKPFTGLRSTFATIADNTWDDERAIDMVLGHKAGRKQGHIRSQSYAKQFYGGRVKLLCEHVWRTAFGRGGGRRARGSTRAAP